MTKRSEFPSPGEYYHVYNRGVEKRTIFTDARDHQRFLEIIGYYLDPEPLISFSQRHRIQHRVLDLHQQQARPETELVQIVAYCLMPNHFHFLVRVNVEFGLNNWIRLVLNSYTRSYNVRWNRVGPLLQGPYKLVHVASNEQLLHLSRYIHLNPVIAQLAPSSSDWQWSSMKQYLGQENKTWLRSDIIMDQFQSSQAYQSFVDDYADYASTLVSVKQLLIDIEG